MVAAYTPNRQTLRQSRTWYGDCVGGPLVAASTVASRQLRWCLLVLNRPDGVATSVHSLARFTVHRLDGRGVVELRELGEAPPHELGNAGATQPNQTNLQWPRISCINLNLGLIQSRRKRTVEQLLNGKQERFNHSITTPGPGFTAMDGYPTHWTPSFGNLRPL